MEAAQLARVKKARTAAAELAERLDHEYGHGFNTEEARMIVQLLDLVIAREPRVPRDGHVKKQGGGIVYTGEDLLVRVE